MLTGLLQLTTLFLIPEIHHLALLIFAVFCIGCVIGVIDVGGQGSPNGMLAICLANMLAIFKRGPESDRFPVKMFRAALTRSNFDSKVF